MHERLFRLSATKKTANPMKWKKEPAKAAQKNEKEKFLKHTQDKKSWVKKLTSTWPFRRPDFDTLGSFSLGKTAFRRGHDGMVHANDSFLRIA